MLYKVKGVSMNPTLLDGDRLWASPGEVKEGQIVIARVADIVTVGDTVYRPTRLVVKRAHSLFPARDGMRATLVNGEGCFWKDIWAHNIVAVVRRVVWPPSRWGVDITARA